MFDCSSPKIWSWGVRWGGNELVSPIHQFTSHKSEVTSLTWLPLEITQTTMSVSSLLRFYKRPAGTHSDGAALLHLGPPLPPPYLQGLKLKSATGQQFSWKQVPRIGMTLVTLLAVNTMINGIKAEMPRVKSAKNPWHQRLNLRWPTSQCPTPGYTRSPTTAASASLSSSSCRCAITPTTSSNTQPGRCSTWSRWRRRTQPSWRNSGRGSSLPFFPSSGSLAMALRPW